MSQETFRVEFLPGKQSLRVAKGTLVCEAVMEAGLGLPLDCGGKGTCGRCRVRVEGEVSAPEKAELKHLGNGLLEDHFRLACQAKVLGDLTVTLPPEDKSAAANWNLAEEGPEPRPERPVILARSINPPAPSLDDHRSDLRRVLDCLEAPGYADLPTARRITRLAREENWDLAVHAREGELVAATPRGLPPLGLAVDLGSTKLAAYLMDLATGSILGAKGTLNPQTALGADVVTRLQWAMKSRADAQRLTSMIREALDGLAGELAREAGAQRERISEAVVVGNTAMAHLYLDLPAAQLANSPFVSSLDAPLDVKARELGLHIAPGAYVHLPPLVGGYVGADNVAMILGTGLDVPGRIRLGLDIGTNTEIVLTVPERDGRHMYIASAPSGPTFEGAHLSSGMRAVAGAVCKVEIQDGSPVCRTMDGGPAAGICGSGIIDAAAALLKGGLVNPRGHLDRDSDLVKLDEGGPRLVLVPGESAAQGREVCVSQEDLSQVQLAKGAIRAAILTLTIQAGIAEEDIEEILLAGSFGSHIDVESAKALGMIPSVPGAACRQVGNAAGKGARRILTDRVWRERAAAVPRKAHYVELTRMADYNRLFARNLAFPQPKVD